MWKIEPYRPYPSGPAQESWLTGCARLGGFVTNYCRVRVPLKLLSLFCSLLEHQQNMGSVRNTAINNLIKNHTTNHALQANSLHNIDWKVNHRVNQTCIWPRHNMMIQQWETLNRMVRRNWHSDLPFFSNSHLIINIITIYSFTVYIANGRGKWRKLHKNVPI